MGNKWVLYDPVKDTQSDRLTSEEVQFAILRLKTKFVNQFLIWREGWPKWKKLKAYLESPECHFMSSYNTPFAQFEVELKSKPKDLKMSPAPKDTVEQVRASFEFSAVHTEEVSLKDIIKSGHQQFNADQLSVVAESDFFQLEKPSTNHISFKGLNKQNAFGKRSIEDRFKIELLLISSKGEMFRTSARDISLSGTFAEKPLPGGFHTEPFDIVVINNMISDNEAKRINLKGACIITDTNYYVRFIQMSEDQKNTLRAGLDYYQRLQKKVNPTG